jgi:hypothetical protein
MDHDNDRMFAFDLAFRLGVPHPDDLLRALSAEQLREWKTWLEANQ